MVDAAYDVLYQELRAGVRENDGVALVNKVLYELCLLYTSPSPRD